MDESVKHELLFLIAKLLKSEFPQIGDSFIHECEIRNMFPSLVFNNHPTFDQLENTSLRDIPDDQLVKLIQLACPHSKYQSLLFNASNKLAPASLPNSLSAHIIPQLSPLHSIAPLIRIFGHGLSVYCLAFDMTDQLLITGADDNNLKIWDFSTKTLMKSFREFDDSITDVQFHPSNDSFAVSSLDCSISLISLIDYKVQKVQLKSLVHILRFSPDGKFLAAGLEEGNIKILHVPSLKEYKTFHSPREQPVAWLSFSPAGKFLVFSADPSDIAIASIESGKVQNICEEHEQLPEFVCFSKQTCKMFISCAYKEHCIKVWEYNQTTGLWEVNENSNLILRHPNGFKVKVVRASFNCDDTNIIAIANNCIFCWETQTRTLINSSANDFFTDHCSRLAMHPFLQNVAFVGCQSGRASIWDTQRGCVIVPLQVEESVSITEAIWSNDGKSVVASDFQGGFTIFAFNKKPFTTLDQFLLSDFTNNPEDDNVITDSQSQPLIPQPKMTDIKTIRLKIKPPQILQDNINEEDEIVRKWNLTPQILSRSASFINEVNDDEEKNQYDDDSQPTRNDASDQSERPMNMSRMSTRHSISFFDRSNDQSSDSSSYFYYNTRSKERRRRQEADSGYSIINSEASSDDDSSSYDSSHPTPRRNKPKPKPTTDYDYQEYTENSYEYAYEEEEEEYDEEESESEFLFNTRPRRPPRTQFSPPPPKARKPKTILQKPKKKTRMLADDITPPRLPSRRRISGTYSSSSSSIHSSDETDDDSSSLEDEYEEEEQKSPDRNEVSPSLGVRKRSAPRTFSPPSSPKRKVEKKPKNNEAKSPKLKSSTSSKTENLTPHLSISIPTRVPDIVLWDRQHNVMNIPQQSESVVYIRDAHMKFAEECDLETFIPPFSVKEDFPHIAFGTISSVAYYVNSLVVKVVLTQPSKIKMSTSICLPLPKFPPILIDRDKYDYAINNTKNLRPNDEIEVIEEDEKILKAKLVSITDDWQVNPFESIKIRYIKGKVERISPWEILPPIHRLRSTDAVKLCQQIKLFIRNIHDQEDRKIFKDWKLGGHEKEFIKKQIRPVDLSLLFRRINNLYYKAPDELTEDVARFKSTLLLIAPKKKTEIDELVNTITKAINSAKGRIHIS